MSAAAETASTTGALGSIRWGVLAICAVAATVEGYDLQVVGYVAPAISREWNLAAGAFGPTFSIGLVGLMLGCLFIAPLSDRLGRKTIIVGSTVAYSVLVLASAAADSLSTLFWMRLATGIGLGGALPNIAASAAEASPQKFRATTVAILFCGFGFGSFVGGFVAFLLIENYGWQSVFIFGGAAALVMAPVLAFGLPRPRENRRAAVERKDAMPVLALMQEGRARATILLWLVYFMGLMDLYLLASWLPTIITEQGITLGLANVVTGLMQVSGFAGALILSPIVDRYGPNPVLPLAYVFAAICIVAIGMAGSSIFLTTAAVLGAGFGIVGCQNCDNGVAAKLYPARIRGTGVGWALGVGRLGSILGPYLVGRALAASVDIQTIFLFSAIPALIAAAAYLAMGRVRMATED